MGVLYTAKVQVKGGRDGSFRSDDGLLEARLAYPRAMGGDGKGSNPEQLFAAGYGACFASTLAVLAKGKGLTLDDVSVAAEVDVGNDDGAFNLGVRLRLKASGVAPAQLAALAEEAKQVCPYSRATRNNVVTVVSVEP